MTSDGGAADGRRHVVTLAAMGAIYFALGAGADMLFGLLPAIAGGFQVSAVVVTWMVPARSASKLVAPVLGVLADRAGRRTALLLSLGLFGLGNLGAALAPSFGAMLAAQGLIGLGLAGAQVSLPALLGDLFPYRVRGRYVGLVLMCGPTGTIVGVPVATALAAAVGTWLPFLAIAALVAGLIPLARRALGGVADARPGLEREGLAVGRALRACYAPLGQAGVRAAVIVALLWSMLSFGLYTFLAAWLQRDFALATDQVGLVIALMGGASVSGNALLASFGDRVGKRRAALAGLVVCALAALLLARAERLTFVLPLLVLFAVAQDFGFGAVLTIFTELLPAQRGAMVALYTLAMGLASVVAPLLAGYLWGLGGFAWLIVALALVELVGLGVAWRTLPGDGPRLPGARKAAVRIPTRKA